MPLKHIGVLESNLSGSGFDGLRVAKELGLRVTFFTSGMERYLAVPGGGRYFDDYVDEIVSCQTNELTPLLERVCEVEARQPFSAFMSLAEYEVVDAALVARALGLPTPDPEGVRVARNKAHMRRRCAEHGVPMPAFRIVETEAAAGTAALEVGLPCVVKPADETSSLDVRRCTTVDEATEHFRAIRAKPTNARGQPRHSEILVEECVAGFEVSVEVLADGRRFEVLGVTDKTVGGHNRFVELGHTFPSLLPQAVRRRCEEVAVAALRAVGFDLGLAHVEVKQAADGPKLIEANPRPAGGKITELVDHSLGISCLELVVRQYLGEHVDGVHSQALHGAAIRYLTTDPGVVTGVTGVDVAARLPGVREAVVYVAPGDAVRPLRRNEDRAGHVLAVTDDAYLAARVAEAAAHEIAIETAIEAEAAGGRSS